jgi:hypothetical protein
MLSNAGVPIPSTNPIVPLSAIIWNGGPPLDTATGISGVPSPSKAGVEKTITLTNNNSTDMIYPFIWEANIGKDPNATPAIPPNNDLYYDPQDFHAPDGFDFRLYIGYQTGDGPDTRTFMGLPSGASITAQLPLVFWNGGNFMIGSDPAYQTAQEMPYVNLYHYNATANISIAGTEPSGTNPDNTTTWVTKSSGYPAGSKPVVVFYLNKAKPEGVSLGAPAQLLEQTFRDPYLKHFINDNFQTYPLINYDVSYVDRLTTPVALEASGVPVVDGVQADPDKPIPVYYNPPEAFGWNAANQKSQDWYPLLQNFVDNAKGTKAYIGDYFGGKGWPEFYNSSPNATNIVIPSAASLFAYSPLTDARSAYDQNYYLLSSTSSGAGPVETILSAFPNDSKTLYINPAEAPSKLAGLKKGMIVTGAGITSPNTKVDEVHVTGPDQAKPYVVLNQATGKGGPSGEVLTFKTPLDDYAVTDLTQLWYSWAHYYVTRVFNDYPAREKATAVYRPPTPEVPVYNAFTLTSTPDKPLRVGMTVSGPGWIRPGTTILNITDADGTPIGTTDPKNAKGDIIYLSLLPTQVPGGGHAYAFGKPPEIPYTNEVNTYDLKFPAGDDNAKNFAGSVYAALSAEAGVTNPPATVLPKSADIVSRVIQFYALLPTDGLPGGKDLTGQVRDVVKSLLRGVWNFIAVPDQNQWYPDPADPTPGVKSFNVYNLDPYVWFIHKVENTAGYAFSVDDDVSNPSAAGPVLAPTGEFNHLPSDLQVAVGGIAGLINQNEWFPTLRWGEIDTTATISKVGGKGKYKDYYMITLTNPMNDPRKDPHRLTNQIFNPGGGEIGAYVSNSKYIKRGTTLIFKGPNGDLTSWVMSQAPLKTGRDIPVVIYAGFLRPSQARPRTRHQARAGGRPDPSAAGGGLRDRFHPELHGPGATGIRGRAMHGPGRSAP